MLSPWGWLQTKEYAWSQCQWDRRKQKGKLYFNIALLGVNHFTYLSLGRILDMHPSPALPVGFPSLPITTTAPLTYFDFTAEESQRRKYAQMETLLEVSFLWRFLYPISFFLLPMWVMTKLIE